MKSLCLRLGVFCKKNYNMVMFAAIFLFMLFVSTTKAGMHEDEFFTFGLSNASSWPMTNFKSFEYYQGDEIFASNFAVNEATRFNYENVYKLQAQDVHPPFYYYIIHTLTSIFTNPDHLMMVGIGLNIVLGLFVFLLMKAVVGIYIEDPRRASLMSMIFTMSYGFMDGVMFIRMYVLLALITMFLFYLLAKHLPRDKQPLWMYLLLYITVIVGTLTQYFFMIYLFFLCLVYGVLLLCRKKIVPVILGMVSVGAGLYTSYLLFPEMLYHIFSSYRGTEAIGNAKVDGFRGHIAGYLEVINEYLFGGIFPVVAIVLLVIFILSVKKIEFKKIEFEKYILLVVPTIFALIVLLKVAPYVEARYIYSQFFLIFLSVYLLGYYITMAYNPKYDKWFVTTMILVTALSYIRPISNCYVEEKDNLAVVNELKDQAEVCIYVYEKYSEWRIQNNMLEVKEFDNVIFMPFENLIWNLQPDVFSDYDSIFLFVDGRTNVKEEAKVDETAKGIAETMKTANELEHVDELFQFGYAKAFYIY